MIRIFALIAVIGVYFVAMSEVLAVEFVFKEKHDTVLVLGKFELGDDKKFVEFLEEVAADPDNTVTNVALESGGGNFVTGVWMSLMISDLGFTTQTFGYGCYSACAVVWMAGTETEQMLGEDGSPAPVGFHGPRDDEFNRDPTADAIMAWVVGYHGYSPLMALDIIEAVDPDGGNDIILLTPEQKDEWEWGKRAHRAPDATFDDLR